MATATTIQKITGHSSHTVLRIITLIEQRIASEIDFCDIKIGGPGVYVQVDESKFGKRKYNRGHHVEGAWVFGGVELTVERKFFAVVVENRNAITLNELMLRHILPGSIVVTDGWKGYNKFKEDNNFIHKLVNHSIGFSNEEGLNTNIIEGTWNGVKLNISPRNRVKKNLNKKLFVFIWRRQNSKSLWEGLIELLRL